MCYVEKSPQVTVETAGRLLARQAERTSSPRGDGAPLRRSAEASLTPLSCRTHRIHAAVSAMNSALNRWVPANHDVFLRERPIEGARRRYQPYYERAQRRWSASWRSSTTATCRLFLIVWTSCNSAPRRAILAQGRGSAATQRRLLSVGITAWSAVAWIALRRLPSRGAASGPISTSISAERRPATRRHSVLYQRYGKLGAALTANVITYSRTLRRARVGQSAGLDQETTPASPRFSASGMGRIRVRPPPAVPRGGTRCVRPAHRQIPRTLRGPFRICRAISDNIGEW